jgi:integrase
MSFSARRDRPLTVVESDRVSDDPITVGAYLEEWLWVSSRCGRPAPVLRDPCSPVPDPVPGDSAPAELRPIHVQRTYRELAMQDDACGRPLSVTTLRREHATLMGALNTAVRRGLINRNPAGTVELPALTRNAPSTWSGLELGRFLDAISEDRLHPLYVLLGLVGLRRGEVVALRWSDVDLNTGVLRVERSAVRVGSRFVVGPPKSSAGARAVAIENETARRLGWHRCRQGLEVLRASGETVTPELVFTTDARLPLDPAFVSRHFDRLVACHGLPRTRLHDLRHTSASIGLASGESLLEVSRRLGHSSITVTADIYSHVSPVMAKESAERLARTVFPD